MVDLRDDSGKRPSQHVALRGVELPDAGEVGFVISGFEELKARVPTKNSVFLQASTS